MSASSQVHEYAHRLIDRMEEKRLRGLLTLLGEEFFTDAELEEIQRIPKSKQLDLCDMEINMIVKALREAHWNQRAAAKILGMSYSSLRRRVAKHKIKGSRD